MTTFIYDGSFEGLLTCVFEAYRRKFDPRMVAEDKYQEELFEKVIPIQTNQDFSQRVADKLQAIDRLIFPTVQHCYLADDPDKEQIIFNYIKKALKHGKTVNWRYSDPDVASALECVRTVSREAHKFKGFLRFQELEDGSWYAACEPDNCIIPLISGHCRERFADQNWIVHDVKRDLAVICREGEVTIYTHTELANIEQHLSTGEKRYQNLWKTFFKNIAIAERKNPKLQRQFMPKKYWKYLVEKH